MSYGTYPSDELRSFPSTMKLTQQQSQHLAVTEMTRLAVIGFSSTQEVKRKGVEIKSPPPYAAHWNLCVGESPLPIRAKFWCKGF